MVCRVCVVGAGIIGTSTAFSILESIPNVEVTLMAEKFTPDTTSSGIAGQWMPYQVGSTPQESVYKWGKQTWDHLIEIFHSPEADAAGVYMKSGSVLMKEKIEDPFWKDIVFNFKHLTQTELDTLYPGYKHGWYLTTMFCFCLTHIPWLMKRYQAKGGIVIKQRLSSLSEIADLYNVIVNCTGIGSRQLVGDKELYPKRGQLVTMINPGLTKCTETVKPDDTTDTYIYPFTEYVYLGGTAQDGDWNDKSDPKDVQGIIDRCTKLVPSLKNAKVIRSWAGLRPARSSIRIEKEDMKIGDTKKKVVHNYGHGGAGVTLHWGCAQEATDLVRQSIRELQQSKL